MKHLILLACLFLSLLISCPTFSYAHHEHDRDRGHVSISFGVWPSSSYYYDPWYEPYYYHHYYYDPYYYPAYTYPSYEVSNPVPVSYQPVVINGVTYYLNNGGYYVYSQYGYQAIAPPSGAPVAFVTTVQPTAVSTDGSITVNIPNSQGGYTPVVLKKSGKGFIGPQGEFYPEFPKVSQLQTMYGK